LYSVGQLAPGGGGGGGDAPARAWSRIRVDATVACLSTIASTDVAGGCEGKKARRLLALVDMRMDGWHRATHASACA
jgi:hypothetical protein